MLLVITDKGIGYDSLLARLSQQIYKRDRTLWREIRRFFTGLVENLQKNRCILRQWMIYLS